MRNGRGCIALLAALGVYPAGAQLLDTGDKVVGVFQVEEAPVLDGVLDDDAWAFASVIEDLHQFNPDEYAEPSQKSQVLVVYSKDALYVAGRFYDSEPGGIVANVMRQGDFAWDDSVTIMISPYNDGRNGYAFDLNPNGVRNQAIYSSVTDENWSWKGIWHGETSYTEDGWIAEIEIPFKTLSFDADNETWGFNVARYIARNAESIGWVSSNRTQNPAITGQITGMQGMQQGIGLDVVPGIALRQAEDFETDTGNNTVEPTLDVFYKPTASLTAALTINTDFSGTGADARQINLTRFGLFFPEQRTFFLQDADIFEFGRITGGGFDDLSTFSNADRQSGRPFFSRRIGLSDGGETIGIDVGGKLTGRAGGWDIGVLGVRQEAFGDLDESDLFVARLSASVLEESSLGAVFTYGDPNSNSDNSLAGLDFRYLNTRLKGGGILEGALWIQQSDTEGFEGDDLAWGASLNLPNSEGLRGGVAYKELEENFYPALGFVNRVGVSDLMADVGYTWYSNADWVRSIYSGIDYQRVDVIDGDLQSEQITLRVAEFTNDTRDSLTLHYFLLEEVLTEPFEISEGVVIPVGDYEFDQYCANLSTGEFRALSVGGYYCGGEFFDGEQDVAGGFFVWRPSEHFVLTANYDVSDIKLPYGDFTTRLASLRADVAFTNTWYWENLVQYDNVSYSMGLNSIVRWVPRAGRELVFVVNREFIDYTESRDFRTVSGDVSLKFSYTFRF